MTGVAHLGFIVAAYGAAALVLTVTIAVLLLDHAAQRRQLAQLDADGSERS